MIYCSKDPSSSTDSPTPTNPTNPTNPTTPTTPVTPPASSVTVPAFLHICGDTVNENGLPSAVYWNNNTLKGLPNASHASGTGIALMGTDVYISCSGIYYGNNVTYWKNGNPVHLVDASLIDPTGNAVAVSGNDVYFTGTAEINNYEKVIPVYWKNNNNAGIKILTMYSSRAQSIAVSGSDVYIAGSTSDVSSMGYIISAATYWKNSVPVFLKTTSTTYSNSIANSIFVSGSDIFVAGDIDLVSGSSGPNTKAAYWKNGIIVPLTNSESSVANYITVINGDIYVAGGIVGSNGLTRAAYWKNGVPTILEPGFSIAHSIAIDGNDAYVVGTQGYNTAAYWKNGQVFRLGKGHAYSVAIKK
jgi:hypothetical protein